MVSNARLDLPEPDRPVTTISLSRGISTETFLRLWTRAPCPAMVVRGAALDAGARTLDRFAFGALLGATWVFRRWEHELNIGGHSERAAEPCHSERSRAAAESRNRDCKR